MKYCAYLFAGLLPLLLLGGCDIAPQKRIGGDPVNTPDTDLDPDLDDNIAAYFYLDRPVVGLRYSCQGITSIPIVGKTDVDGRFVCPRRARAKFFVGTDLQLLWLGEVDLRIYGEPGGETTLNRVVITPSTLYGTIADSSRNEVTNIFNLLTALDLGGFEARSKIYLANDGLDVNGYVAPFLQDLNLLSSPNAFAVAAEPMLQALREDPDVGVRLVNGGQMYQEEVAMFLTDAALRRARAGVYRNASPVNANDPASRRSATTSMQILAGRSGVVTGLASALVVTGTADTLAAISLQPLVLQPDAAIAADGLLSNLLFESESGMPMTLTGRLVNDWVYGSDEQLDPQQNVVIPGDYLLSLADIGETVVDEVLKGAATLYRAASSLPDVPLELFEPDGTSDRSPGNYLPLDFAIFYKGYANGSASTEAQRDDAALLVDQPPLLFRIRADGDIVSDVNGDCSDVNPVSGELRDESGQREYLIGQVGSVFKADDDIVYMTLLFAVYDPGHPAYGFTFGTTSLFTSLTPVVLNTRTGELRSKLCPPDAECTERLQWMNDVVFAREVYGVDLANGNPPVDDPDRDDRLYQRGDYIGKVTGGVRYCVLTDD